MIEPWKLFGRMGNTLFKEAYLYAQMREGIIPDTYVQDFSYFEKYKDEIKQLFGEGIGFLPYIGIHLRRGDYVNNSFYCQLWETGYYIDAINEFPDRKFIVFSDDIPFAKIYFEGDKFAFDESETDLEAFNKLASCEGHIISNSSWSAWAAYLSPSLTPKVIAPNKEKWHRDGVERTVCPKEWVRI